MKGVTSEAITLYDYNDKRAAAKALLNHAARCFPISPAKSGNSIVLLLFVCLTQAQVSIGLAVIIVVLLVTLQIYR